uniref:prepilin peptidase n=1 Tax=Candidatus Ventrimonas sp. TaxID=3048889 RepID=UPI003FEDBD62
MMTGIQNVNSLEAGYYAATLIFIGWFALYDFRRHLVRNQALAIFFFWCLLSLLPVSLLILQAVMGFLNGGLILLAAAWITHGGIGGGDIKLAALLGLLFGTRGVCLILFIAAISALAFVLLISGRNRSSPLRLPFVPFLFLGSVLWVFL